MGTLWGFLAVIVFAGGAATVIARQQGLPSRAKVIAGVTAALALVVIVLMVAAASEP